MTLHLRWTTSLSKFDNARTDSTRKTDQELAKCKKLDAVKHLIEGYIEKVNSTFTEIDKVTTRMGSLMP
jgi:hypothetical protein